MFTYLTIYDKLEAVVDTRRWGWGRGTVKKRVIEESATESVHDLEIWNSVVTPLPPPPHGPKCSQFHAVFWKFWKNSMLAPPPPPECWPWISAPAVSSMNVNAKGCFFSDGIKDRRQCASRKILDPPLILVVLYFNRSISFEFYFPSFFNNEVLLKWKLHISTVRRSMTGYFFLLWC